MTIVYFFLIIANLLVSIIRKELWKYFYFIYFLLILLIELIIIKNPNIQGLYNFLDIFSILFFGMLIIRNTRNQFFLVGLTAVSLALAIWFFLSSETPYSINAGITYCIYCIFISLIWFYEKITGENSQTKIYDYRLFWIFSSLLLSSVFYLFRMTPMYWFDSADKDFLSSLNLVFQASNIVSYLLFLRGLFGKI